MTGLSDIGQLFSAAQALHHAGKLLSAQELYVTIIEQQPTHADALNLLGAVLIQRGMQEQAVPFLRRAVQQKPTAPYCCNLGVALTALGRYDEAKIAFERAIQADRRFADAYYNLGNLLKQMEVFDAAIMAYEQARSIDPSRVDALINTGNILYDIGRLEDAIECFTRALGDAPDAPYRARALINLGNTWRRIGDAERASEAYDQALTLGDYGGLRIKRATTVPVITQSWDEIKSIRTGFEARLRALIERDVVVKDPLLESATTNFWLAYHGLNDRDLQMLTASLHLKSNPALGMVAGHCDSARQRSGRLRVGFVSAFFRRHSVGRLMEGLIAGLSREIFEIVVVTSRGPRDPIARRIEGAADTLIHLPSNLAAAREAIAAAECDILIYPEIGMDVATYYLAFARLAPVQCVMWGHPDTTGIPNIDWFLSSALIEGEGAEAHYSENLYRMNTLPTCYGRPILPASKSKADFGFDAGQRLYFCPQSTLKHHPDLDPMIAAILRTDGEGQVLLMEGAVRHWSDQVKARIDATIPDVAMRVRIVPRLMPDDYVALMGASDVIFDTPHWSGGNTSFEAFALGKPVVTHIGTFMRGRVTLGQYRAMGFGEEFARTSLEDCAALTVKLGTEIDFRRDAEARVAIASAHLFDDRRAVEEFQRFLLFAAPRDVHAGMI